MTEREELAIILESLSRKIKEAGDYPMTDIARAIASGGVGVSGVSNGGGIGVLGVSNGGGIGVMGVANARPGVPAIGVLGSASTNQATDGPMAHHFLADILMRQAEEIRNLKETTNPTATKSWISDVFSKVSVAFADKFGGKAGEILAQEGYDRAKDLIDGL